MTETKPALTPEEIQAKEKQRIVTLIVTKGLNMTQDYKNTIKYTGGLLSTSMGYAYSKGIQDVIKLITKEEKKKNETV